MTTTTTTMTMTMDKDNITLLLLSLLSALFLLAYLFPKPKSNNNNNNNKKDTGGKFKHAQSTANANANANNPTTYYTKEQVSKHNTRTDCWIIVKHKVYDVTSYVEEHPGGDAILNNAGRDSTEGFYGPQHATRVFDMVDEFYIGDLKN
ncbi:Cytochrome B5-like protein [Rhynchospora pubera]|uniref:Cytochrome B5-like protein n=1 Tax=Rhynchospora pubera TaxID=906938 RepID=A0AAV8C3N1_9POAL|nr:Cytochrome B5-like protein [Rhynchospora pubera]